MERSEAVELVRGLVEIPSFSGAEGEAARWLVERLSALGLASRVDRAGNAIGQIGAGDASRLILLLGHIDTVPGEIPVRIETAATGTEILFGRGSVDAKGPLAAFVAATARLGDRWASAHDVRVVVAGAVEEEAATSKGARHLRDRFDGEREPLPDACVIGEPSRWHRVTLGYKGRLLLELEAQRSVRHTAGPDPGLGVVGFELWRRIWKAAEEHNEGIGSPFDQLQPSLRSMNVDSDDGLSERLKITIGLRLPLAFECGELLSDLTAWLAERFEAPAEKDAGDGELHRFRGPDGTATLRARGYEAAWRGDRSNALVRSFLGAIREHDPGVRPGFVVKTGTSDMNVVGPAWRCPILAYGPGDSALDHTPNEHLDLDEYWRAVRVLEAAIRRLAESWS